MMSADTGIYNSYLFGRWFLPAWAALPFVLYPSITLVLE
jgi:hypothetical protein